MCNSVATIFTMDIYRHSINAGAKDAELIRAGRITTAAALAIAAMVTPMVASMGKLFAFIQEYTGFVTPGVLCIFLLGLFWKRMSSRAAIWVILLTIPISLLLKVTLSDIAFLDRMTIVFFILMCIAWFISRRAISTDQWRFEEIKVQPTSITYHVGALIVISLISVFYVCFA